MSFLKALFLVLLLVVPASAQSFYMGGMLTDSQDTVTSPTAPAWASKVQLDLLYRSRFEWGRETDFVQYEGDCYCDFFVDGYVGQHATLITNGNTLVGGRTKLPFAEYGACVTFDGAYDWAGSSGNGSGLVYKTLVLSKTINVADLGPTVTVDADGTTTFAFGVNCFGSGVWDCYGSLINYTSSWWEAQLSFTWIP